MANTDSTAVCELQYNYISETNHSSLNSELHALIHSARQLVNPWRIVRADGVVIASSYDSFTSKAQSEANGRLS